MFHLMNFVTCLTILHSKDNAKSYLSVDVQ